MNFNSVLKEVGLPVSDNSRAPAPGSFNPVGILWHHTAGVGDGIPNLVKNGHSTLSGPLCNYLLRPDGEWVLITTGKANDSGRGSSHALARVRGNKKNRKDARERGWTDDTDGNQFFYDIEVEHVGTHGKYPKKQIKSLVIGTAAMLNAKDWGVNRVIHHRQWTARKIDMSYRGDLWTDVKRVRWVLRRPVLMQGDTGLEVMRLNKRLSMAGLPRDLTHNKAGLPRWQFKNKVNRAVETYQAKVGLTVDGIVGKRTWLALFDWDF